MTRKAVERPYDWPENLFYHPIVRGIPITQTVVSSFLVMVCLCIAGILLGRNLQKRPSRRQVLVEKGVSMLYGMVEDTMGKHNSYWTPYIGALFSLPSSVRISA